MPLQAVQQLVLQKLQRLALQPLMVDPQLKVQLHPDVGQKLDEEVLLLELQVHVFSSCTEEIVS